MPKGVYDRSKSDWKPTSGMLGKHHSIESKKKFVETRRRKGSFVAWNKGLVKETDERVEKYSFTKRGKSTWSKGLTKETDERVKRNADAIKKSFQNMGREEFLRKITNPAVKVRKKNGSYTVSYPTPWYVQELGHKVYSWDVYVQKTVDSCYCTLRVDYAFVCGGNILNI